MDQDAKKTALRMIPYGIYVLTADDGKGNVAAATVNWVTQTAFAPPLVVVGVKTDSGVYQIVKNTKTFALNMLGKDGKGVAFTFFKPTKLEDGKLSLSVYTAEKGLSIPPEQNVLQELSGSSEQDKWQPTVEVFKDVPHVARSSQQQIGRASCRERV